jgi:accessory gene regulator B
MLKSIETRIDTFAKYLQQRNNLDHIAYLKMRLGMQVFVSNFFKTIVAYSVSILCNLFFYTLTVHITYFLIRHFAHGAHAKTPLLCHIQNLLLFVFLPWLVVYTQLNSIIFYTLGILSFIVLSIYAPAATKKQPIPARLKPRKKRNTIIVTVLLIILSMFLSEPYQQLVLLGIIIIAVLQLPIFFPKEDV